MGKQTLKAKGLSPAFFRLQARMAWSECYCGK